MAWHLSHLSHFQEALPLYTFAKILNPELKESVFQYRLKAMIEEGFQVIAAIEQSVDESTNELTSKWVGASGFWVGTRIYSGKYLEPDNFAVLEEYRSKGVGNVLLEWLIAYAKNLGCEAMMLDAYIHNQRGHAFYERFGFEKKGFHFVRYFDEQKIITKKTTC